MAKIWLPKVAEEGYTRTTIYSSLFEDTLEPEPKMILWVYYVRTNGRIGDIRRMIKNYKTTRKNLATRSIEGCLYGQLVQLQA